MARKFVTLKLWHPDCWMLELCERHRDVRVECRGVHANRGQVHADALIHGATQDALEKALTSAVPHDVLHEVLHRGADYAEVYSQYPGYRSVYQAMVDAGFLVVGPVVHLDGYERWQVVGDAAAIPDGLAALRELAEVHVERVRDTSPPSRPGADAREGLLARLADGLSERQFDVLARAVGEGYYQWPRGKNVKGMAAELGISGPTCLEHIRRAESRIVPAVVEELRALRARGSRGPERRRGEGKGQ